MSLLLAGFATGVGASSIELVSYTGGSPPTFVELNDPVMGGLSNGTFSVSDDGKYGVFDGNVVDVPSLSAPGFIKAAVDGKFADASAAVSGELELMIRSSTPEYKGFRVAFASGTVSPSYACSGGGSIPFSRGCFKANFKVPAGSSFVSVRVPFSSFSDKWSPATGEQTVTCANDTDVCPTAANLAKVKRIEIWAEGVKGHVHLELASINAVPPALSTQKVLSKPELVRDQSIRPPKEVDTCSDAVQTSLLYGISGRKTATVPVSVNANETLAEAVCCDSRVKFFAEPQFTFEAPDIQLFEKLGDGETTFYDSVCGLPLFVAPRNRTMAEFKADTQEHGWPSFRDAETNWDYVRILPDGEAVSVDGTHLGHNLPDRHGNRYCINLVSVAGNKK